jgi:hypothetical protein
VLRIVADGLGRVRETAEGALEALGTLGADAPSAPGSSSASGRASRSSESTPEEGTSWTDATSASDLGTRTPPTPAGPVSDLAIPDYDELSASQVVDRLDGLAPSALDAIGAYETAHRGRATILGKIEQLR